MKLQHPKKPGKLYWLADEVWQKLSLKQKDYYIFRYIKGYTKEDLMRRLYLTNSKSFANFLYQIKKINQKNYIIKNDNKE